MPVSVISPWTASPPAVAANDASGHSATNAVAHLTTPTYDGSGKCLHPDVLYFASGWNGSNYWMAVTPYPAGNARLENPSILACNDGSSWAVPAGLTNPIVADPGSPAGNSDPDLVYNPDDSKLYCFYRYYDANPGGNRDILYVRSSSNGTTWSAASEVLRAGFNELLSPALLYLSGVWHLWYVNATANPSKLIHRTSSAPTGPWSPQYACAISAPSSKWLWHFNVIVVSGVYQALPLFADAGTYGVNPRLYWATSHDGISWDRSAAEVVPLGGAGAWDAGQVYRSSMVYNGSTYDIWYPGDNGTSGNWFIGKTSSA